MLPDTKVQKAYSPPYNASLDKNEYNIPYNSTLDQVIPYLEIVSTQFPAKQHKLQATKTNNLDHKRNTQTTHKKAIYPILQQQSTHYLYNIFGGNFHN
jgi:hypothetical protein